MSRQISDSIPCGILLALSGGCMDAYSYLCRGHVFANAQTGNIIFLGLGIGNGDYYAALRFLWPVLAFAGGIIISDIINRRKSFLHFHWRQISVLIEAIALIVALFISSTLNNMANIIISFACGIQIESFRKIHGHIVSTTMCVGNLRSGIFNIGEYFNTRDKSYLRQAYLYFGIIVAFVAGAFIESRLIMVMGGYGLLLSPALLIVVLIIMFKNDDDKKKLEKNQSEL